MSYYRQAASSSRLRSAGPSPFTWLFIDDCQRSNAVRDPWADFMNKQRHACLAATHALASMAERMLVGSRGIVFGGTKHASIPDLCAVRPYVLNLRVAWIFRGEIKFHIGNLLHRGAEHFSSHFRIEFTA